MNTLGHAREPNVRIITHAPREAIDGKLQSLGTARAPRVIRFAADPVFLTPFRGTLNLLDSPRPGGAGVQQRANEQGAATARLDWSSHHGIESRH
jgi:hypothetical protein